MSRDWHSRRSAQARIEIGGGQWQGNRWGCHHRREGERCGHCNGQGGIGTQALSSVPGAKHSQTERRRADIFTRVMDNAWEASASDKMSVSHNVRDKEHTASVEHAHIYVWKQQRTELVRKRTSWTPRCDKSHMYCPLTSTGLSCARWEFYALTRRDLTWPDRCGFSLGIKDQEECHAHRWHWHSIRSGCF